MTTTIERITIAPEVERLFARNIRFEVRPRYSAGSNSQVDRETALRVAGDELTHFEITKSGAYGEAKQQVAETIGLTDIVLAVWEKGGKYITLDLLTGDYVERKIKQGHIIRSRDDIVHHVHIWQTDATGLIDTCFCGEGRA
jgi:hypothetical protein